MAYTINIWKFTFVCKSDYDRIAFHHTADAIYRNRNVGNSYCQYYNRTRERWTFQTAVLDSLYNAEENNRPNKRKYREEWLNSPLKKAIDEAKKLARENLY
jgi:hypothetical protein